MINEWKLFDERVEAGKEKTHVQYKYLKFALEYCTSIPPVIKVFKES